MQVLTANKHLQLKKVHKPPSPCLEHFSNTISMFPSVRADFGQPLPFFLTIDPALSIFRNSLSNPHLLHYLPGNTRSNFLALYFFSTRKYLIRTLSSSEKGMMLARTRVLNEYSIKRQKKSNLVFFCRLSEEFDYYDLF